ncbi:MAG: hypothetical protein K6F35_12705 [Lachnospiraceae bacterium]|nr:hypothetical protein [Lachnospiraceae bacterium]
MRKHYGITGQTVKAKSERSGADVYPWDGLTVPVKITAEYPAFLVGTVLPHFHPGGFGPSRPYTATISKHDVAVGEMILNGGAIV